MNLTRRSRALVALVERHENLLWALHSLYALAIGIGVMWLGRRHYGFLRAAVFHVLFIWLTTLLLPLVAKAQHRGGIWHRRIRLVINYFNKNLYQQILFFVLPIYFASATFWSPNVLFLVLLAGSALVSTIDVVYDRHLSTRPWLAGVFFGFNLFAWINVALPTVWRIGNLRAMRVSVVVAILAFITIAVPARHLFRWAAWRNTVAAGGVLVALVEFARPIIPPAPLQLGQVEFGTAVSRRTLAVVEPLVAVPAAWSGRVHAIIPIKAPLGLEERVRVRWHLDGEMGEPSPLYRVAGGRTEGYRLWTSTSVGMGRSVASVRIDVETEGGQLIGRANLNAERETRNAE